jgi:hypothetical protein
MAVLASICVSRAELAAKDPDIFLPDAFDSEPDLVRLNLRIRDAMEVIGGAGQALAYMAIPFVLSVHHAYGVDCLRMIAGDYPAEADGESVELSELHTRLMEDTGSRLPDDLLGLFDLLRAVRNRITHYAGVRGSHLNQKWRGLSRVAQDGWRNVAGRDFPTGPSTEELALDVGELIGALMVVTRLGREMNEAVVGAIARDRWASIAAEDFRDVSAARFAQQATRLRRFRNFVREFYGALEFNEGELVSALQALSANRPER